MGFAYLTLVYLFAQHALATPQTHALFEPTIPVLVNTTTSTPTALSQDSNIDVFCSSSPAWLPPGSTFDAIYPDCVHATMDVLDDAGIYRSLNFEFLAVGERPTRAFHIMRTPRRYTYRSCTAIIVNLHDFPPAYLPPHARQRPFPVTETASFDDLYENMDTVLKSCMEMPLRPKMLGWAKAGERGGLGVFLVGRRSDIDIHVPASAQSETLQS